MPIHSSLPSIRATSPRDPANPAQTVLLLNGSKLPTAGISVESSEETFPYRTEFVTKFGPRISLLPVPIFGVNTNNLPKSPKLDNFYHCFSSLSWLVALRFCDNLFHASLKKEIN
jgi:hypothetical protein